MRKVVLSLLFGIRVNKRAPINLPQVILETYHRSRTAFQTGTTIYNPTVRISLLTSAEQMLSSFPKIHKWSDMDILVTEKVLH